MSTTKEIHITKGGNIINMYHQKIYSYDDTKIDDEVKLSPDDAVECKACGKLFVRHNMKQKNCARVHYCICPICGEEFEINLQSGIDYIPKTCKNSSCRKTWSNKKMAETNLERYGSVCSQNNKAVHNKTIETWKKNHNGATTFGEIPVKDSNVKNKIIQINTERYGVEHPSGHEKGVRTCLSRYGVDNPAKLPEIKKKMITNRNQTIFIKANNSECVKDIKQVSLNNLQLKKEIELRGYEVELEYPINQYLYDLHIKNTNILIEINPTFWHSTVPEKYRNYISKGGPLMFQPSTYHQKKSITASTEGYHCITLFDWDEYEKVIKYFLDRTIKINAAECTVSAISLEEARSFMNFNNLQGYGRGSILAYGMIYHKEIVAAITIKHCRKNINCEFEINRYCNRRGVDVSDSLKILIDYYIQMKHPSSLRGYVDASKFTTSVYNSTLLKQVKLSEPRRVWSKHSSFITDTALCSYGFDHSIANESHEIHPKGSRNIQLMLEHGWLPVYDCGQYVFEYRS